MFGFRKLSAIQNLVLSFIILIILGTILLVLPVASESGKSLPFIDALFTSTSAVCVTGLIVVDTPTAFSTFGELVILLLIQLGGIGIVTFGTLIIVLMGHEIRFRSRLILKESYSLQGPGQVMNLAWTIIKLTLVLELAGALILTLLFSRDHGAWYSIYLGIFHSISAFCNAGFSLFSDSLENYSHYWLINLTFMALIILGGLGFPILSELLSWKRGFRLSVRAKIVLYSSGVLIAIGAVLIHMFSTRFGGSLYTDLPAGEKFLLCLFQSVTARTAGFNTIDLNLLPSKALLILIALMFIGGSPQSTAGGIKTTTFWIIILGVWNYIHGGTEIRAGKKEIKTEAFIRAVSLFIMAFLLVIVAEVLMSYYSDADPFKLLFETVSAFGTVGLSLGITNELNSMQKLIIIALMFIGRIGPISLAFFLFTRKTKSRLDYPEIDIPTG